MDDGLDPEQIQVASTTFSFWGIATLLVAAKRRRGAVRGMCGEAGNWNSTLPQELFTCVPNSVSIYCFQAAQFPFRESESLIHYGLLWYIGYHTTHKDFFALEQEVVLSVGLRFQTCVQTESPSIRTLDESRKYILRFWHQSVFRNDFSFTFGHLTFSLDNLRRFVRISCCRALAPFLCRPHSDSAISISGFTKESFQHRAGSGAWAYGLECWCHQALPVPWRTSSSNLFF